MGRAAGPRTITGRLGPCQRPRRPAPAIAASDGPTGTPRRPVQRSAGRCKALPPSEVRFAVRLTPRAPADRVEGVVDGVLRARVSAPPIEGAANHALLRLIADELGIGRRSVRLVAGAAGRTKLVVVEGVPPEVVLERWPGLAL